MRLKAWNNAIDRDVTEISDVAVERVPCEEHLELGRKHLDGIENGRGIHQELQEDRPQVIEITKENIIRRQHKPDANVEQEKREDWIDEKKIFPRNRHIT